MLEERRSHRSGSVMARRMTRARSAESPVRKCRPSWPLVTASAMPPISLQGAGGCAGGELVAVGRGHLAVIGADRIIVVQGVDDPGFRHDAPDQDQHLHA